MPAAVQPLPPALTASMASAGDGDFSRGCVAGQRGGAGGLERARIDGRAAGKVIAAAEQQPAAAYLGQTAGSAQSAGEGGIGVVVPHAQGHGGGRGIGQAERAGAGQSAERARRSAIRSSLTRCRQCPACYSARPPDCPGRACRC